MTALAARVLDAFEAGESADFALLEEIMRYATGYPDTHHHPVEDIVFDRLKQCEPAMADELDAVLAEHEDIIALGRRFLDAVEAVEEEAMVSRAELLRLGRDYLTRLNRHMDAEEARLFPAATASLTESDWEQIRARIQDREDPLFGASRERAYSRLWQLIQSHRPDGLPG